MSDKSIPNGEAVICGAGLCGSLLAIFLTRRGFKVTIYESRPDIRKAVVAVHRSINLIITSRGRFAVRNFGAELEKAVMGITVPVLGRAMHDTNGRITIQPYGKDDSEKNYSVSRAELNKLLMTKAEEAGARIVFDAALVEADPGARRYVFAQYANGKRTDQTHVVQPMVFFGCDGAGAASRQLLTSHLVRMNPEHIEFSTNAGAHVVHRVKRLGVSYKELMFPRLGGKDSPLDKRYLHIWPRGSHFLMGLPNQDGSVTGTLYLPDDAAPQELRAEHGTEKLKDVASGVAYMKKYYSDAVPILGDLRTEWKNPNAWLASVQCNHWVFGGSMCLLGDAAHAITPFFGQGMNISFEDVTDLMWVCDQVGCGPHGGDWAKALRWYQHLRKQCADDLCELAEENYVEMASKVGDPNFIWRKQVEVAVERAFPTQFRSRYWMITHTLVPYNWVREAGRIIDEKIIEPLTVAAGPPVAGAEPKVDIKRAGELITEHFTPYLKSRQIDLSQPWHFYTNRPAPNMSRL